ncbi:retron system putative HNH endonuclease [Pseudoduganella violacea]|uniref:Uncharacterized protein (TIGR02646 family) n=1 Tax=Pseudoduganella violacea TaxID=1715466 RepID=A0A7W5B958_9BURK|nr:retron system putative HNH endonuclease [Pseudoduganella violacea]MBB3118691.1 uncharacterized protein (TIGR02646 family) [Pseudoduganella violacea]
MKRIASSSEPSTLMTYRQAVPGGTWEAMRNDPYFGGMAAYENVRAQVLLDQGGICAYCEVDISAHDPLKQCRVEHFHPKSDISAAHNWALDWQNLLAVCAGGSYRYAEAPHALAPIEENLSCDAHKDRMIQRGKLQLVCDGWILHPAALPASPSLFLIEKWNGNLAPDAANCAASLPITGNRHADVLSLVQHTIDMLNLNCERLCQARLRIVRDIEHNKKKQRLAGFSPTDGMANLAQHYLRQKWPAFFTTIRLCLGTAADSYLAGVGYQG